jgi:hypothetical protein
LRSNPKADKHDQKTNADTALGKKYVLILFAAAQHYGGNKAQNAGRNQNLAGQFPKTLVGNADDKEGDSNQSDG